MFNKIAPMILKRPALVSIAIGITGLVFVKFVVSRRDGPGTWDWNDSTGDGDSDNEDSTPKELGSVVPPHLERLLYKEKRRKESSRHMAMKKPMYDNIEMYSPGGKLLCTISVKKAEWYIKKNLGKWMVEDKSIILLFEPKSVASDDDNVYNQSHKKNVCVVCGDSERFMRHYVVPYCYRQLFPTKYKERISHDIVIVCPDCHLHCERSTQERQKELENSLRKDAMTAQATILDRDLRKIKSLALALYNKRDALPHQKVVEYENEIKTHFGLATSAWLSKDLLWEATNMEVTFSNPYYIPGPDLVISTFANSPKAIEEFVISWRHHFVTAMQPRFLPIGWDVNSPVHN